MIVNCLWVGDRLSTMERLSLSSYLHHKHEVHLWSYAPIANVPAGVTLRDAAEIVPESEIESYQSTANFSDYFRYRLLYKLGGWWVDMDTICLKPFDFRQPYLFTHEGVRAGEPVICGGFILAPPASPIMEWCAQQCKLIDTKTSSWGAVGPQLLTSAVKKFRLEAFVHDPDQFQIIPWWEITKFVTVPPFRVPSHAYALHLWHHMWSLEAQDVDGDYPALSLYESWKKKFLPASGLKVTEPEPEPGAPVIPWSQRVTHLLDSNGVRYVPAGKVVSVSVIIPCFNHGKYLPETVTSVKAQTFKDWELILVNDGSTDDSLKEMRRFTKAKIVNSINKGLPGARNAGALNSCGDYLLFLDADDLLEPTYLAKVLPLLADPAVGIAASATQYFGSESRTWTTQAANLEQLKKANSLNCTALIRREAFLQTGGYTAPSSTIVGYEDWCLWLDIVKRGWKIAVIPDLLFKYRKHAGASMHDESWKWHEILIAHLHHKHPELYS